MLQFTEQVHESHIEGPSFSAQAFSQAALAKAILSDVMQFRRSTGPQAACASSACQPCSEPHLSKVVSAIQQGLPIRFVLPAFPGKSPNPAKVLGVLPDMAEVRALAFLQHLCDRVKQYYPPGADIVLCSDGRVFSDVVGLRDDDVTAYQRELSRIILENGFKSITTFDLDDLYAGSDFDHMRKQLMDDHGDDLEVLKAAVRRGAHSNDSSLEDQETNRLYCGITRFLVEDAMLPGQGKSRTAIQNECRVRAYKVIQRSQAWSCWVEAQFPEAVRLSIHPQICGSKKLGIRLLEPDHWLTPWHAVAVEIEGRFILVKRTEAEKLGARLVHLRGRPSHYSLDPSQGVYNES